MGNCAQLDRAVLLVLAAACSALAACDPAGAPAPAPSAEEISRLGAFDEPLLAVGAPSSEENRALAAALTAYRAASRERGAPDAVEPILKFLAAHPDSPWGPSLNLELGAVYRQTGHFSRALATWQATWAQARALDDAHGRIVADAAAANLSQLEAYLGRKESLAPLLDELAARPMSGTAAERVGASRRGLGEMRERPENSFRCGPLALQRIYRYEHRDDLDEKILRAIEETVSTPSGLSLKSVRDLSRRLGMNYQMAFRPPGAPMIVPAVAHWKVGHFAAVVSRDQQRYLIGDDTFGENIRVAPATFDEEASGYLLVPSGPLPAGWRAVADDEGETIWGRGNTGNQADTKVTGPCDHHAFADGCGGPRSPITTWDVHAMLVSLSLQDTPVGYAPPLGPAVYFGLYYAYRDVQQPMTGFNYFNLGNKWTTTWLSYVTDSSAGEVTLYGRGGGAETFELTNNVSDTSIRSLSILTRAVDASGNTTGFTLRLRDGSFEEFNQALGNKFFMTAVSDPYGNRVTLQYDAQMRLTTITDAIGQVTTLSYELSSDPLKVTKVTDPFGRAAVFTYTTDGHLASITDILGITSQFVYGPGDFVNTLTTPYGTSKFTFGDGSLDPLQASVRSILATDALGRTKRVEFAQGVQPGDQGAPAPQGMAQLDSQGLYLLWRNTFIWNPVQLKAAMASGTLDYTLARNIHWTHTSDHQATSGQFESTKEPLENRVWYTYPGQMPGSFPGAIYGAGFNDRPNAVGRVFGDGTTQVTRQDYDAFGNVVHSIDPAGREHRSVYADNGLDLLSVANTTNGASQTIFSATYSAQHQPLTITDIAGQTSTLSYNSKGQLTSRTDALGHVSSYSYDSNGYLTSIVGPSGANYSFTRDPVGRVASATDAAGETVSFTYDAADRLLTAVFPDGTTAKSTYQLLDLASATDRLGNTASFTYDAERQLLKAQNALGKSMQFTWCDCGGLASITDYNGNQTTFLRDLQGRVTARQFADGRTQRFRFDFGSSRILSVEDSANQTVQMAYNADGTIAEVSYPNALNPTAPLRLQYDSRFSRLTEMVDGIGKTTFEYHPIGGLGANQVARITSPIAGGSGSDVVSYAYDELGRVVGRELDGVTDRAVYDELDRATLVEDALDSFKIHYADPTGRAATIQSQHGPEVAFDYYDSMHDGLLKSLSYSKADGTSLANYGYSYDANHRLTNFTESYLGLQFAGNEVKRSTVSTASLLVVIVLFSLIALKRKGLKGIFIGLLLFQIASCHHDNNTMNPPPPDMAPPPPTPNAPSLSTSYTYDATSRLTAAATVAMPSGSSFSQAIKYAYDANANLTSLNEHGQNLSLTYNQLDQITGPISAVYDPNGNPTTLSDSQYSWDANNRLIAIKKGAHESDFAYDGVGRMVRILEKESGQISADHAYLWCGDTRCIERDNLKTGSPITKRYYQFGVSIDNQSYYFITDESGSVRQLVDGSGQIRAQYEYDPYGAQNKISGDLESDIGYAGYFRHAASGLYFTRHRAYDPKLGRWLNRDPAGTLGGLNVYAYVGGAPTDATDASGLGWIDQYGCYHQSPPFDIFLLGEGAAGIPFDPVSPEGAVAGFVGWNSKKGFYAGSFQLVGVKYGGEANYIGQFAGGEESYVRDEHGKYHWKKEGVTVSEFNLGPEVPGVAGWGGGGGWYWSTDGCESENGPFVHTSGGALGEHGAIGIGFPNIKEWLEGKLSDFIEDTLVQMHRNKMKDLGYARPEDEPPIEAQNAMNRFMLGR